MTQTTITFRVEHKPAGFMGDATRPWTVLRTQTSRDGRQHTDAVARYETKEQAQRCARDKDKRVNG